MNDTAQAPELVEIAFDVNGTERRLVVDPSRSLVDVLRRDLGLTGAHVSCEIGVCGVCTVVMNDEPVRACLVLAVQADGGSVRTVEGLAQDGELASLQEAFREAHGLQCGFCTPGFLMLLSWYLERLDRTPDDDEIREIVSSNLCRCTGYQGIVDAVRLAVLNKDDARRRWQRRNMIATGETRGVALGDRVLRTEDLRFLVGGGRFVDDVVVPDALHVAFVRSMEPHGDILSVETSEAASRHGVIGVFTGRDLVDAVAPLRADMPRSDWQGSAYHALAVNRVRFVGEPVAAVVATEFRLAVDASERVVLDVRPLEPLVDVERALAPDATPLHPGWRTNLFADHRLENGDVATPFASAAGIVRLDLKNRRQVGLPLEPRACVVSFEEGRLTLWTSSQVPQIVRAGLVSLLGLGEDELRVISPDVGGGFGVKQQLFPEELVLVYLARALQRSMRWTESSLEHLLASVHAREQYHVVEAAYDANGRVTAVRADIIVDAGAYSMFPSGAGLDGEIASLALPGPYNISAVDVHVRSVATNKCPVGPYRGVGRPAACFSIERVMDAVAAKLGLDPLEVRRRNVVSRERFPYRAATGVLYDSGDYEAVLDALRDAADYSSLRDSSREARQQGRCVGVGIACFIEHSSFVSAGRFADRGIPLSFRDELIEVRIGRDGRIEVKLPTHNHGQAHETTAAQIVASVLGCPLDVVDVLFGDTEVTPFGIGTFNSRSVVSAGSPLLLATRRVRDLALEAAAAMLECDVSDLELSAASVGPKGVPNRVASLARIATWLQDREPDVAPQLPRMLGAEQPFGDADATGTVASGAHLAVVEVDPRLGTVAILRYVAVEDCGLILNPLVVRGQIQGGVAQGIGGALLEEFIYGADGQPLSASLADYVIPGAWDVPEVEIHHVVTPSPLTAHGGKGMAEGATIPVAAVLAAAIDDALVGYGAAPLSEIPFTPERMHRLLADAVAHDRPVREREGRTT